MIRGLCFGRQCRTRGLRLRAIWTESAVLTATRWRDSRQKLAIVEEESCWETKNFDVLRSTSDDLRRDARGLVGGKDGTRRPLRVRMYVTARVRREQSTHSASYPTKVGIPPYLRPPPSASQHLPRAVFRCGYPGRANSEPSFITETNSRPVGTVTRGLHAFSRRCFACLCLVFPQSIILTGAPCTRQCLPPLIYTRLWCGGEDARFPRVKPIALILSPLL